MSFKQKDLEAERKEHVSPLFSIYAVYTLLTCQGLV